MISTTEIKAACQHCGSSLEPLTLPSPFGSRKPLTVGWKPCQCTGARREHAELLAAEEAQRQKEQTEKRLRAYEKAGIKPRFIKAEHPMAARILEGVNTGIGAYICGPVGTGKTHLASAIARMAVDAGMRVKVTDILGILAAFKPPTAASAPKTKC